VVVSYRTEEEEEMRCALKNIRKMSVHEPGEPETSRSETSKANSKHEIDPDLAGRMMRWVMRWGSAADRFHSLVLEALATFPIPHDCFEEREEAFRVLAGLHGTNLVPIRMQTLPYMFCPLEGGVRRADVDNPKVIDGIRGCVGFIGSPQTALVLVEDEVLSFIASLRVREVDRIRV